MDWTNEFAGRRVLVTGACGTLGRWLVRDFRAAGARLALTLNTDGGYPLTPAAIDASANANNPEKLPGSA